jgi:hypothetical protein
MIISDIVGAAQDHPFVRRGDRLTGRRHPLTSYIVSNVGLACSYGFLAVVFGWAATVLLPWHGSAVLMAAGAMAGSATVGAVSFTLAAVIVSRVKHGRPAGRLPAMTTRLARVHLGGALGVLLLIVISNPAAAIAIGLIPVILAAFAAIFLLNTRDAIRSVSTPSDEHGRR